MGKIIRCITGADNLNDYNLKGNSVYNVQLNIKGIDTTDYSLDNAPETMGDNTAQAVGNGTVYKFAGCIWMDRGIGATTANPSKITTLGYSYQWGCKDPFVAASELSGRNELVAPSHQCMMLMVNEYTYLVRFLIKAI